MQISHKNFRNIGLIGRPDKYSVVETLCLIHDHILGLGLHPVFDSDTAQLVPYKNTQTVSRALLGEVVDLVIVVGGDGSLLHAARALVKYNTPVTSMGALLASGYDAIYVGSGAPKGKELNIPGRSEADADIHIGITWLESVAFGHVTAIKPRVLVIGAGNTAMDCCRTAKRIGGTDVKVIARGPRSKFRASPWELHDAEEERIDLVEKHAPHSFIIKDGKLAGMRFERPRQGAGEGGETEIIDFPCDVVILAIGQDNAFPWIERDIGIEFNQWGMPIVNEVTFQASLPGVFFGGDAAWGPKNIIWAVAHGHQAAISIHNYCQGRALEDRPKAGVTLTSQKMGMHEWSFDNDYDPAKRTEMILVGLKERFESLNVEVEVGYNAESAAREVARCLNCDIQTAFTAKLCIECDACVDICPTRCLTMVVAGDESEIRDRLSAPILKPDQPLYASPALPQTGRLMVKDENLCIHCGLCAERCPTAAWDMMKSDIHLPKAGI